MIEAVLFGASGYTGLEVVRILAQHPAIRLAAASSDRRAGERVSNEVCAFRGDLEFASHDAVLEGVNAGQLAILATDAPQAAELAAKLLSRGLRVVDLSGAHRLRDPALYPEWYGFSHPNPRLVEAAHYGLADWTKPEDNVTLIANPGCYATASALAIAPLLASDLADAGAPIVVDGKSGATGAGRKPDEALLFSEVSENLRPYRVLRHQHTPEIEQTLSAIANRPVTVSFTAHLVPMRRGLVASAYVRLKPNTTQQACDAAFLRAYGQSTFVRYRFARPPETAKVRGSNFADVACAVDARTGIACAFAAIDNLGKGAAGQAIQNINLLHRLDPSTGLLGCCDA